MHLTPELRYRRFMMNRRRIMRVKSLELQGVCLHVQPDGEYNGTITEHRAGCGKNRSERIVVVFPSMPESMRRMTFSHDLLRGRWLPDWPHAWLADVKAKLTFP